MIKKRIVIISSFVAAFLLAGCGQNVPAPGEVHMRMYNGSSAPHQNGMGNNHNHNHQQKQKNAYHKG